MSDSSGASSASLRIPKGFTILFAALAIAGAVAFLTGIHGAQSLRVWQAYLVNFLFWTGLSIGAVFLVAVLNMTDARWGRPIKRLAEAFGTFLPVGFLLFWVLYFGRGEIFPWVLKPLPVKAAWLNAPFLFARNGFGLLLITALALAMVRSSLKMDRLLSQARESRKDAGEAQWRRQRILSPILGIVYGFGTTLMGFDLVMSLDPNWYSTLYGGYFFIGTFYTGVAAVFFLALLVSRGKGFGETLRPTLFHDLGKLLLAFCLFTGYFFYAQFIVIWYGNIPEETRHLILRTRLAPWEPLAWVVLSMIFFVPFVTLLSRRIKIGKRAMMILSLMVMTGMWLERFLGVVPSLWQEKGIPLGFPEGLITCGFLGIVGLCLTEFLKRVPIVPLGDPLYQEYLERPSERLRP